MVISFSVKEAREQLLNEGVVYTYRFRQRAFFKQGLGHEENTWANEGRGTKKIANVKIVEIGELPYDIALSPYQEQSGFKNLWDWQWAIHEMRSNTGFRGWLYRVQSSSGKMRK